MISNDPPYCVLHVLISWSSSAARSCDFQNGDCVHQCFYDVDGNARCKCDPGYIQHRVYEKRCFGT